MMNDGSFRPDLYARLAGLELALPPLRERREDLGLLLARLLPDDRAPTLTSECVLALMTHAFPLNVRELRTTLARALPLAGTDAIDVAHLPPALRSPSPRPDGQATAARAEDPDDAVLEARLVALLQAHAGNVSAVARDMDAHRRQVQRWLHRFKLDPTSFK